MAEKLGVDIGGVISAGSNEVFTDRYLSVSPNAGCFEALSFLNDSRFYGEIYLVSKCGLNMQRKTREWLEATNFYDLTGINRSHLNFCLERCEKAPICREIGITHFIDDRLEVLSYMDSVSRLFLFNPNPKEIERQQDFIFKVMTRVPKQDIYQVKNWSELLEKIKN